MKKAMLIIVLALLFGGGAGIYIFKYSGLLGNKSTDDVKASPSVITGDTNFQWGINMRPSAMGGYEPVTWEMQIKLAQQLGVKWVRLSYDYVYWKPFERNDEVINALTDAGLNVMLVIEPTGDWLNMDLEKNGYENGKAIAAHYKGKIKYYQMANEGGAMIIKKGTMSGQQESDYDKTKYEKLKIYLNAVSKGISESNPDAIKVVTFSYTHTAYIDMLLRDKVDFDVVGLDWYEWMGQIDKKKLDNRKTLVEKIKSWGKELIIAEANISPAKDKNSKDYTVIDQDKQSNFIKYTADWAYANKDWVKGFYVLELVDNVNVKGQPVEYFGIVETTALSSDTRQPGAPRKAFYTYLDLITKYTQK